MTKLRRTWLVLADCMNVEGSDVLFPNVFLAVLHFKPFRNELDHPPPFPFPLHEEERAARAIS